MGPERADEAGGEGRERRDADVDEQEDESFPASDPHSDWAGPASESEDEDEDE